MFRREPARVKRGVGQREQRQHLAVVVDRNAAGGAGCGPRASAGVDHDGQRPQAPVGVQIVVAAQPLGGHADVAQHAPGHGGVDGGLELQEDHQRPPRTVPVGHPPDRVGAAPRAVVDPLAGEVGEGVEVEQRGDFGEEALQQVFDDDGQREELLPGRVVACPRRAFGHLGTPCNWR